MKRSKHRASDELVLDSSHVVQQPDAPTEFEIQAFLWSAMRDLGINVRGEVKTKFAGRAMVRFDLAVFKDDALAEIIEVKRSKIQHRTQWADTRQGVRYAQFKVPVHVVYGMEDAQKLLESYR